MAIDQKKMMQNIHDIIYDSFTAAPPVGVGSNAPLSPPERTFLTLAFPGIAVDVSQFANAWTPTNASGSLPAAENLSVLVDVVPNISTLFSPSSASVERIYGDEVVNAAVDPIVPDPRQQQAYERAFRVLNVEATDYDDSGRQVTVWADSPGYRAYKNKQRAYSQAMFVYMSQYIKYDLTNPADQAKWSLLGPQLQPAVDIAYSDLMNSSPGVYEDAIATMGQYEASSVATIFSRARQNFEQTKRASLYSPGNFWHWCDAFPANWFAESAADNFTLLSVNSSSYYINENSHFSSYSGGAGASFGLWSVGGGSSGSFQHQDMSSDTSNLTVSFKMGRVELRRRWFRDNLFSLSGWQTAGRRPGGYSNGALAGNDGYFPLIPTGMLVARDVTISGVWGHRDSQLAASTQTSSASVGWGPFSCSGSYTTSSSSSTYRSTFDGTTLKVPGVQILGFLCEIIPFSPPRPTNFRLLEQMGASLQQNRLWRRNYRAVYSPGHYADDSDEGNGGGSNVGNGW